MRRSWWVTVLALTLLLTGCTGSSGRSSSGTGAGSDAGSGAAASAADGAGDAGAGGGEAAAAPGASAADPDGRQVVTTAQVAVRVEDPRAAADAVTAGVEDRGGRVDERAEQGGEQGGGTASATLVVRVPSDQVSATVAALRDLGQVGSVTISSDDVTGAAQDLDARIDALRASTSRLEALIAGASTTGDLITAEQALTDRQAALEQLEAQRARLAEQVSLSTLRVSLSTDPAETAERRGGFVGGLSSGWRGLVSAAGALAVVAGALLPWVVVLGALAAAVVAVRRRLRRRGARTSS